MTQEQIIDNIILEQLEEKYPSSKEIILSKTNKENRRLAMLSIMDDDRKLFEQYKNIIKGEQYCSHYADETIQVLRNYIKVADTEVKEHGEVMTPLTLVEEMLDKLPVEVWSNPNLKWLDPCNGVGTFPSIVVKRLMEGLKNHIENECERYRHIIENMIYVCEIQAKNMFLFHCTFDREDDHQLNSYYGSFLDNGFDEHMKNVWGLDKFDIVLGNPPYKKGLHYKFLIKGFNFLNNNGVLLLLHPPTVYFNRRDVSKTQVEKDVIEITTKFKSELTFFWGDDYFDEFIYLPLSITKILKKEDENILINYQYSKNKFSETIKNINEIYIHANNIVKDIKNKILLKANDFLINHIVTSQQNLNSYYLIVATMSGHKRKNGKINPDFYTIINKKYENDLNFSIVQNFNSENKGQRILLNSYQECENTYKYLLTKFARFCLSLSKINQHLDSGEFQTIPFMDPNILWDDETLYEYFDLTDKEIKFIDTFIEDYYEKDKDRYNENYHLSNSDDKTKSNWFELKNMMFELENVKIEYKKDYINFWNDENEVISRVKIGDNQIRFSMLRGNLSKDGVESKYLLHLKDERNLMQVEKQSFSTVRKNGSKQEGFITYYTTNIKETFDKSYFIELVKQKYNHLKTY